MEAAGSTAIQADPQALVSFALYLLIIIIIGIVSARFSSSGLSEFFLAGRKLKTFVVALSAVVSGRSAWLLIGVTGILFTAAIVLIYTVLGGFLAVSLTDMIRKPSSPFWPQHISTPSLWA